MNNTPGSAARKPKGRDEWDAQESDLSATSDQGRCRCRLFVRGDRTRPSQASCSGVATPLDSHETGSCDRACEVNHPVLASILLAFALCAAAIPAAAQQPPPDIWPLTTTLDLRALRDLPSTDNLFALLETTQPEVVSDRFSGSVNLAEPARLGVFLTVLDADHFSSGRRRHHKRGARRSSVRPSGAHVAGRTGDVRRVPGGRERAGVADCARTAAPAGELAGERRGRRVRGAARRGQGAARGAAGAAGRMDLRRRDGRGPIAAGRAGVLVSASITRASQFDRGSASTSEQAADSIFSHLVFTPTSVDEVRTIGWRQVTRYPGAHGVPAAADGSSRREASTHLQSTWQRESPMGVGWRVFGAVTERGWDLRDGVPSLQVIERLVDGPPSSLAAPGGGRERRMVGRLARTRNRGTPARCTACDSGRR